MGIKWVGMDKLERIIMGAPKEVKRNVAGTLFREGHQIMTASKSRFVPVDQGTLRASGDVEAPEIRRNTVSVTLGYGGAAKKYAVIQHEAMHFQHTVGGPKYLERPVNAAMPSVIAAIGRAVEDSL